MKVISIQDTDLERCIKDAQRQKVVITRKGKPMALIIGVKGKDLEQVELGCSDKFWALIEESRKQKTITRAELERRLAEHDRRKAASLNSVKK